MENYLPFVSVIIPVYNGARTLPECLSALRRQTYPTERYEIIVVDDGSTDHTAEIARAFGVTVISQKNAGPAAARNRGARAAQGDLLLFTDADCTPTPDWIQKMTTPFADPTVVGAKGAYLTHQRELLPRFVQLEYESRYDRMRRRDTIDFIDTYSAAYRRDIFPAYGGFDTSFPTASVEDQELSFRLAEAGHRLLFVPEARVYHLHDRTLSEYIRRKFWIGYWKVRVMRTHPARLLNDSHTPQTLKAQMVLAALGALFLGGAILWPPAALLGLVLWAALPLTGLPFILTAWRRDRAIAWLVPPMLFVRAWALGLGFACGLLPSLRKER